MMRLIKIKKNDGYEHKTFGKNVSVSMDVGTKNPPTIAWASSTKGCSIKDAEAFVSYLKSAIEYAKKIKVG